MARSNNHVEAVINWSNQIAHIARQTENNLQKIQSFNTVEALKPPKMAHQPSVNNFFLQVEQGVRSRTPNGRISGLNFDSHNKSRKSLDNFPKSDINLEIRTQLDKAKDEINSLHFEAQQSLQKEALRLGIQNDKPLFADISITDPQLRARLEVYESEISGTLKQLLKAYSSLQKENVSIQRRLTDTVTQSSFEMQLGIVSSRVEQYKQQGCEDIRQVNLLIQRNKIEQEKVILQNLQQITQSEPEEQKAEVFTQSPNFLLTQAYVSQKIKQINQNFGPKFQHFTEMLKNLEEKLQFLTDVRNDAEIQFEDFKSNNSLKLKVFQDSNNVVQQRLNICESKVKELFQSNQKCQRKIKEIGLETLHIQRIEAIEQKLSHDFIQNLIKLQIEQTLDWRLKDWEDVSPFQKDVENQLKQLKLKISILEQNNQSNQKNEMSKFRSFSERIDSFIVDCNSKMLKFNDFLNQNKTETISKIKSVEIELQRIGSLESTQKQMMKDLEQRLVLAQTQLLELVKQKHTQFDKLLMNLLNNNSSTENTPEQPQPPTASPVLSPSYPQFLQAVEPKKIDIQRNQNQVFVPKEIVEEQKKRDDTYNLSPDSSAQNSQHTSQDEATDPFVQVSPRHQTPEKVYQIKMAQNLIRDATLDLEESRFNVIEMSSEDIEEVISDENSELVQLKQEMKDPEKRRTMCQKLTFEICADLIATEMVDIFKSFKLKKIK